MLAILLFVLAVAFGLWLLSMSGVIKPHYQYTLENCPNKGRQPTYSAFGLKDSWTYRHPSSGEDLAEPWGRCSLCGHNGNVGNGAISPLTYMEGYAGLKPHP